MGTQESKGKSIGLPWVNWAKEEKAPVQEITRPATYEEATSDQKTLLRSQVRFLDGLNGADSRYLTELNRRFEQQRVSSMVEHISLDDVRQVLAAEDEARRRAQNGATGPNHSFWLGSNRR